MPNAGSEVVPDAGSEVVPDARSEVMTEAGSEGVPDARSEVMSDSEVSEAEAESHSINEPEDQASRVGIEADKDDELDNQDATNERSLKGNTEMCPKPVAAPLPQRTRRKPDWLTSGDYVVGKFEHHANSVELMGHVLDTYGSLVSQFMSNCNK